MSSNIQIKKICIFCKEEFIAKTIQTKYCSHKCNQKHYKAIKRDEKVKVYEVKEHNKPSTISVTQTEPIYLQGKQFLSVKETSLLLGVSSRTIQRLVEKRLLVYGKIGRRTIIQRNDIDKLFK